MKRLLGMLALVFAALCAPAIAEQPLPSGWNFVTVDDTTAGTTVLTGINNLGKVTGYHSQDHRTDAITAEGPSYSGWIKIDYPGATDSAAMALDNTQIQAGFYFSKSTGTVAYYRDRGKYVSYPIASTEFLGHNEILCPNAGEHCHGENKNSDALFVGFTFDPSAYGAFMYDAKTSNVTPFNPPGAVSAVASGINGKGEVCGWFMTAIGTPEAWFYSKAGVYYVLSFPNAVATYAWADNWQENIVGQYLDAAGITHGFAVAFPMHAQPTYVSVDYPGATRTVIRSINDQDQIVGTYTDASGVTHGFLANPYYN